MSNAFLVMHKLNHLSCLFTVTTKVLKFKQIYGDKFNTNIKFNLNLRWFQHVDNRNLDNNGLRKIKDLFHNTPQTITFSTHMVKKV